MIRSLHTTRIATALLALAAVAAVPGAFAQGGGRPAPVKVDEARIARLAPSILVSGTVLSRDDARRSAEVPGNLVEVAEVGAVVKTDAMVARIDNRPHRAQVAENEGLVAGEQARIEFLEKEVERLRRLSEQNVAARSQLDQTESNLAIARSDLSVARARLRLAQIALGATEIRAPFDARVTERFANPGERVSVGDEVVRLVNPDRLEVVARAPLDAVGYLEEGATVALSSRRNLGEGSVRAIVPFADARTHMFEIRVDVTSQPWVIGENVQLTVPTAPAQPLLSVHRDAIVLRSGGAAVFRIDAEGKAERVSVTTGSSDADRIAVIGDLRPGDAVVVRGAERLNPGQAVSIIDGEAGKTDSAAGP